MVQRVLYNILTSNLEVSKKWYIELFDFELKYDSDWFVNLKSNSTNFEIGIIIKTSNIIPDTLNPVTGGHYITFVIEDVNNLFLKCQELNVKVIEKPHDTFYGQRRMILKDPDENILDVSSLI